VEFPGLQDQLDQFEMDLGDRRTDPRALYIVWAGANDFFVTTVGPEETIANGIKNTMVAIHRLRQVGALHIMVINMPDLGLTPLGGMMGNSGELSFLTSLYNRSLDAALDQLKCSGPAIIRVDSAGSLQRMVSNPEHFGFSNVTDAYLETGGNPADFLFWDALHTTTLGHQVLAEDAFAAFFRQYRAFANNPAYHARVHR
jgi:phospholipase/lecithinase/hemolysin